MRDLKKLPRIGAMCRVGLPQVRNSCALTRLTEHLHRNTPAAKMSVDGVAVTLIGEETMSGTTMDRLQLVAADDFLDRVHLDLFVTDPEVVAELLNRRAGRERDEYALSAMRLGVLALRQARGHLDGDTLRREGDNLLTQVQAALTAHQKELNASLATSLKEYFDPQNGRFNERVDRLLKKDGELESLLARKLTGENSELQRTLTDHVGKESSLFKLLSPDESKGILQSLRTTVGEQLEVQSKCVLKEFSLDNNDSALSRLVSKLTDHNGELKDDLKTKIDAVVKEFSLDEQDSALSRLVRQVDCAQKAISSEFSLDNTESALSRMKSTVDSTNQVISRQLTLDDETSSLYRLKRELLDVLGLHQEQSKKFQLEVGEQLAKMQTRREESARSTRHGDEFEAEAFRFLQAEAQAADDIAASTGQTVGLIKNAKTGDAVITLGPHQVAAGAKIVVEAKEKERYDLQSALVEIEKARKNRGAQCGLFVFSRKTAPVGLDPVKRFGDDVFVVWDSEDPASDLYLKLGLSLAKALCTRPVAERLGQDLDFEPLDRAVLDIEKQAASLDEIRTFADTVCDSGDKIRQRINLARKRLLDQAKILQDQLVELKHVLAE